MSPAWIGADQADLASEIIDALGRRRCCRHGGRTEGQRGTRVRGDGIARTRPGPRVRRPVGSKGLGERDWGSGLKVGRGLGERRCRDDRLRRPCLAPLERLQYGGTQLGRGNRILEDRHRSEPKGLFGPFGMKTWEQQDHRDLSMLAPHVGQELECLAVERINARQHQIDVVPLQELDRRSIIGGLLDGVAQ